MDEDESDEDDVDECEIAHKQYHLVPVLHILFFLIPAPKWPLFRIWRMIVRLWDSYLPRSTGEIGI